VQHVSWSLANEKCNEETEEESKIVENNPLVPMMQVLQMFKVNSSNESK